MRYMISASLRDAVQFLAAYVVDDAAREAYPELTERGYTQEWADSIKKDLQGPDRQATLKMILDQDAIQVEGSSMSLLSNLRLVTGESVQTLLSAEADLHQMITHFEKGEGEDYEDPIIPLMKLGYSKKVVMIIYTCGGLSAWITARTKRLSNQTDVKDTVEKNNMRFKRAPAFLGVRPWVYDGVVSDDEPAPTEEEIQVMTSLLNVWDVCPTKGRWT